MLHVFKVFAKIIFIPYFFIFVCWVLSGFAFDYRLTVTNEYFYLFLIGWSVVSILLGLFSLAESKKMFG